MRKAKATASLTMRYVILLLSCKSIAVPLVITNVESVELEQLVLRQAIRVASAEI
jgi:hypothetical protein